MKLGNGKKAPQSSCETLSSFSSYWPCTAVHNPSFDGYKLQITNAAEAVVKLFSFRCQPKKTAGLNYKSQITGVVPEDEVADLAHPGHRVGEGGLHVTSYTLQVTSYRLQAVGASYEVKATSYKLRALSYELRATSHIAPAREAWTGPRAAATCNL